jgi:hypothetical protein
MDLFGPVGIGGDGLIDATSKAGGADVDWEFEHTAK